MLKNCIVIGSFFVFALAGCTATPMKFTPEGGSRADGIVRMAFLRGYYENTSWDKNQAQLGATKLCNAWGYSNAEEVGFLQKDCAGMMPFPCTTIQVSLKYQCIGAPGDKLLEESKK